MELSTFFDSDLYIYFLLPLLIFCSRLIDVSIGTLRIVFVSRGLRYIAPLVGFFEVLIWITAMSQIMKNLSNPITYFAYAAGFATGTYLGLLLEEKLSLGNVVVRIIMSEPDQTLAKLLQKSGYGTTSVPATGARGPVQVLFSIVERKKVHQVVELINSNYPDAFYTIEEVKSVHDNKKNFIEKNEPSRGLRKGK